MTAYTYTQYFSSPRLRSHRLAGMGSPVKQHAHFLPGVSIGSDSQSRAEVAAC